VAQLDRQTRPGTSGRSIRATPEGHPDVDPASECVAHAGIDASAFTGIENGGTHRPGIGDGTEIGDVALVGEIAGIEIERPAIREIDAGLQPEQRVAWNLRSSHLQRAMVVAVIPVRVVQMTAD
jgi:hypothetical protein